MYFIKRKRKGMHFLYNFLSRKKIHIEKPAKTAGIEICVILEENVTWKCTLCYSEDILTNIPCKHKLCGYCKDKIMLYYNGSECIFCYNERMRRRHF